MIDSILKSSRALFALALTGLLGLPPAEAQQTQRIYFVGNSVTDSIDYSGLAALAQTRGNVDTWSRLMIPGSPLSYLWEFRANGSGGFVEVPYGNPDKAFTVYSWDILSLQPFDRLIEGSDGDRAMVGNFYNLIKPKSPDCKVFIHAHWPRTPGGISPLNATIAQYNDIWLSPTYNESRKFYEDLTMLVRSDFPATSANIRMAPYGELFYSLNNNQAFLSAAGLNSIWGVYADGIHLNGIGSYITACLMYAMSYYDDPTGLGVPGAYGAVPAAALPYIHQAIKDVIIAKSAFTGISYFGPAPVQSIKLNASAMELNVTKSATLVPVFTPSNAAHKTVTWSTSNGSVASVTDGVVTANAVGSTNITATTIEGGFQSVCAVSVLNSGTAVSGISLNKSTTSILIGNTETLVATVTPAGASNKSVVWTTSDPSIATVSAAGLVTSVKKGIATITATSVNGLFSASTTVTATRLNNPPVAVMKYSPGNLGYAPYKVTFDGRSSSDPDPEDFVLGYDWIIKQQGASTSLKTEISNTFDYTFASAGVYEVTLQAVDNAENLRSLNTEQTTITVLTMPQVPAAETAICYEGFDYVNAPIIHLNGGRGWREGWDVQDGRGTTPDEFAVNNVSPLTVPGLRQVGNYMSFSFGTNLCGRYLDISQNGAFKDYLGPSSNGTMIGKSGTTLWFSSIIRPQNNSKVASVSLVDTGVAWYSTHSGRKVEFGGFGGTYWGFAFGFEGTQVQHLSNVPIVNDVPVFLVAKVEFGATSTVSLYVNPAPGNAPTGIPIVGSTDTPLNFRALGTTFGGGLNKMALDEIRLGASYADVAPFSNPIATFRTTSGLAADGTEDLETPAGDGVQNLIKYAFNMIGSGAGQATSIGTPNTAVLAPNGAAGMPLVGNDVSNKLTLTFIRRKGSTNPGISYVTEFSDTLGTWGINSFATETAVSIDSNFERVTVTDSDSFGRRFVRVKISAP